MNFKYDIKKLLGSFNKDLRSIWVFGVQLDFACHKKRGVTRVMPHWFKCPSPIFWQLLNFSRFKIHMSHGNFWFIQLIQLIWIFYEIHEFPWLWIWKHMNFYEYESVHSWISMTMNFKSHEFQFLLKKPTWAVWQWIRRQVELFIELMWFVWILNLNIEGVYE